ncbi:MAG TPA: right-handed parallel beta-helix repeat-containing protein [Chloroflexota bacterium]
MVRAVVAALVVGLAAVGLPYLIAASAAMATLAVGARADCTLYASPGGSDRNGGTSPASPLTLGGAAGRTVPGDVVCLLAGTYSLGGPLYIARSGSPQAWVTYASYDGQATVVWAASNSNDMFQVTSGTRYIEVNGLSFDGRDRANTAVKCLVTDHVRVINNTINNAGGGGILTSRCDYVAAVGNRIHHAGYGPGWSSGVSYNSHLWSDQYQGFHSFVVGNIISGTYDASSYHTDGNGIIMDLAASGTSTPPVLIANNLVYQNGGRCIHTLNNSNSWVVNNTCYKNTLDLQLGTGVGEYVWRGSAGNHVLNNLVDGWENPSANRRSFVDEAGTPAAYARNVYHGAPGNVLPASVLNDPNQVRRADPLFVDPVPVDPTASRQYASALPPTQVGSRFMLRAGSPAIGAGIDPRTDPAATAELRAGMEQYLLSDLAGRARPPGGGWDLGAYQYAP